MKIKEKEITDNEVLDMLNCPVCLSVVNAIKLKQRERACSLYNAYDLVAGNYGIQFNSGYNPSACYPYILIDDKREYLDEQKTMVEAQKEILHKTMYELARRIENGKKNIHK